MTKKLMQTLLLGIFSLLPLTVNAETFDDGNTTYSIDKREIT